MNTVRNDRKKHVHENRQTGDKHLNKVSIGFGFGKCARFMFIYLVNVLNVFTIFSKNAQGENK